MPIGKGKEIVAVKDVPANKVASERSKVAGSGQPEPSRAVNSDTAPSPSRQHRRQIEPFHERPIAGPETVLRLAEAIGPRYLGAPRVTLRLFYTA